MAIRKQDGKEVCWATHPKRPNRSGHARGRKYHLTADRKTTLCAMKVDKMVHDEGTVRAMCANCENLKD